MKNIIIKLLLVTFPAAIIYSQNLTEYEAKSFIKALLTNSEDLNNYFDAVEQKLSDRLGISYSGVKHKLLISLDIDPIIKKKILDQQLKYEYKIEVLDTCYSKLVVNILKEKHGIEYIFHNSRMISKPSYYSRNWVKITSKYFVFHISEASLFNYYSVDRLDSFVENMLVSLKCNNDDIQKLKDEKIHYFLCRDESEIEQLTGYSTLGLYYIANDFIISTFNCHYHELLHLLINYKLKSVSLFTLPLLQEGFAVAFGGRGGKEPNVILDMGLFLVKSNFLDYRMLLSKSAFYQYDASMSYPVAGLYVKFLIKSLGIEKFLALYAKYSSYADEINKMQIDLSEVPKNINWENYLTNNENNSFIKISGIDENDYQTSLVENEEISIYVNNTDYLIKVRNSIGLKSNKIIQGYDSKLFKELFPTKKYQNEKYIISANADEVSIYNIYTNNLIAKYVKGFSLTNESVHQKNGYFIFSVSKIIFDEHLESTEFVLYDK